MGLVDIIVGNVRKFIPRKNINSNFVRISKDSGKQKFVIIFLGWKMKLKHFEFLYPKFPDHQRIIYQLPTTLLSEDFKLMKKSWSKLLDSVNKDIKENNVTSVFGISLGTALALYAANRSKNIKNVFLTLPLDKLAPIFWDCFITKLVIKGAKKKGYTKKDMDKVLSKYDLTNNLNNLNGKKIRLYIAKSDSVIPSVSSKNLISKMKARSLNVSVKEVPVLGHYFGGLHSALFVNWMK